ncbi:MAG: aminoacyl-histidine dipeptidase [Myxococcota bacterium]|jgi:dipeptidase D|nr:aminoacyl-histidine dipeptidase [Myxococcota bacterium]
MQSTDKTKAIMTFFEKICAIPHGSTNEAALRDYLRGWAAEHGFTSDADAAGNLIIRVPASPGKEDKPTLVLQGHLDMVCEKTPQSNHDFSKDAIRIVEDGEWIRADNTTLGADNGLGLAMAMAAATDPELKHPPLELLMTVEEETGLIGANGLQPGFVKGRILLNLDSEDLGYFTVGCAGGRDARMQLKLERKPVPAGLQALKVVVGGLEGGHSGVDINLGRANAIKLLARMLVRAAGKVEMWGLSGNGGSAHNAIPRDASLSIAIKPEDVETLHELIGECGLNMATEYLHTDPNLTVGADNIELEGEGIEPASFARMLDYLLALPHGVAAMTPKISTLVESSCNLATFKLDNDGLSVLMSQRSSVMSRLHAITDRIGSIARLAGASFHASQGYPAWQPNMDSPLLARCVPLYEKLTGKKAVVEVIHAGLECGIIGSKYPGMDMISFGPTIKNPHSPQEKAHMPSVGITWDFLVKLIESY